MLAKVSGVPVAYGYRSVFVQKHHCHGLAHNVTSSDNNTFLSVGVNSVTVQKFNHSGRGAGQKAVIAAHNVTYVFRKKCVNILFRRNVRKGALWIKVLRNRHLKQNSVNIAALCQRIYDIFKAFLADVFRKSIKLLRNSDFGTGPLFVAYIYF